MLRALRRVLIPTLATLLLYASSVAAECAWVLWVSPTKSPVRRWEPRDSFAKKENCERRMSALYDDFNPRHPHAPVEGTCLPDTVDPRGPKGK